MRRLAVSEPILRGVRTWHSCYILFICYSFAKLAISSECLAVLMMYVEGWWRECEERNRKREKTHELCSSFSQWMKNRAYSVCACACACVSWHVWGGVWASRGKAHKTHDHTDEVTGSETRESLSFPVWFYPSLSYLHLSIFPLFLLFFFLNGRVESSHFCHLLAECHTKKKYLFYLKLLNKQLWRSWCWARSGPDWQHAQSHKCS